MNFPIVVIKEKEAPIYFFNKSEFGLISKGGESFYNKGIIYDSFGNKYIVRGMEGVRKAAFLKSIKYFQQMYIANIKYDAEAKISLSDFKEVIISHINSHIKYWIKKDLIDNLIHSIMEKNSIKEIIRFIR